MGKTGNQTWYVNKIGSKLKLQKALIRPIGKSTTVIKSPAKECKPLNLLQTGSFDTPLDDRYLLKVYISFFILGPIQFYMIIICFDSEINAIKMTQIWGCKSKL